MQGTGTISFPGAWLPCALGSGLGGGSSLSVSGLGSEAHGGPGKPQRDGCAGGRPCQSAPGSQPHWPRQTGGRPAEMQFYNQPVICYLRK